MVVGGGGVCGESDRNLALNNFPGYNHLRQRQSLQALHNIQTEFGIPL
jgi:hypothetical protein